MMPATSYTVTVYDGYYLQNVKEIVTLEKAYELMTSKYQYRYTSGKRDGDQVELSKHLIVCPHCGYKMPAYQRFVNHGYFMRYGDKCKVNTEKVADWTTCQLTLFGKEQHRSMMLNRIYAPDVYRCRKCGLSSTHTDFIKQVDVKHNKGKISLSCELNDLQKILSIPFTSDETDVVFPITETTIFDLNQGGIYLEITNQGGQVLATRDFTNDVESLKESESIQLIEKSSLLLEKVGEEFRKYWKGTFPFDKGELSAEKFVFLTKYVNFPRSFFDGIPFEKRKWDMDESFRDAAKRIRKVEDIYEIYENSTLAKEKAMRRIIYENPAYCFYISELELLSQVIGNNDLFKQLFKSGVMYEVAGFLHDYPSVIKFLQDYRKKKGAKAVVLLFQKDWLRTKTYALKYVSMNSVYRQSEMQKWGHEAFSVDLQPRYSHPILLKEVDSKNTTIDGYTFVLLRTTNDFYMAGHELKNCLKQWREFKESEVYVVRRGNKYLAAIELRNDEVIQARTEENGDIKEDERLYQAYKKWCEQYGVESRTHILDMLDEFGELPDEPLPF